MYFTRSAYAPYREFSDSSPTYCSVSADLPTLVINQRFARFLARVKLSYFSLAARANCSACANINHFANSAAIFARLSSVSVVKSSAFIAVLPLSLTKPIACLFHWRR